MWCQLVFYVFVILPLWLSTLHFSSGVYEVMILPLERYISLQNIWDEALFIQPLGRVVEFVRSKIIFQMLIILLFRDHNLVELMDVNVKPSYQRRTGIQFVVR